MANLTPDAIKIAIASTQAAGQVLALSLAVRRSHWKQWPFLTALLAGSLLAKACQLATPAGSWSHFWVHWAWAGLSSVLQLLVLVDLSKSFPGASFFGIEVPLVLGTAAAVVSGGAAWLSTRTATIFHGRGPLIAMMNTITLADRALSVAVLAFFVCFLVSAWAIQVGWSRRGAWMCQGTSLMVAGAAVMSSAFSLLPSPARDPGLLLAGMLAIVALALWCVGFSLPEEAYQDQPTLESLLPSICAPPVEKVG